MANPPITVGELTDVPAPQSPVNAQFHQEVANRIVHRFPNAGAMNAWAAANGSLAFTTDSQLLYNRVSGAWQQVTLTSQLNAAIGSLQAELDSTQNDLVNVSNAANAQAAGLLAVSYAGFVDLNTSTQVVCSVTWNANPARWYRLVGDIVRINSGASNQDVVFVIENNVGDDYRLTMHRFGADPPQQFSPLHLELIINGLSGSQTWRLAGNTSTGGAQIPSGLRNASNAMLTVEDMGAV